MRCLVSCVDILLVQNQVYGLHSYDVLKKMLKSSNPMPICLDVGTRRFQPGAETR